MVGAAQRKPKGQTDDRPAPNADQREQTAVEPSDAAEDKPVGTDDLMVGEAPVSVKVCSRAGSADTLAVQ